MKRFLSAIVIVLLLVVSFGYSDFSQNQSVKQKFKIIDVTEEITYVVKYLAFEIGEIRLNVVRAEIDNGDTLYYAIAYIDSYAGIPFVDLHQIYETKFDKNQNSHYFKGSILSNDITYTIYDLDKSSRKVRVLKGREKTNEVWTDSTINFNRNYLDGLSLFYYARMRTGVKSKATIPVLINEKYENTTINFYDEVENVDIDAVSYDIACVRLDGETEFRGIFGLTGYFEGWFTNDEHAVPIIAKMQVIIGSIKLELKEWKKKGWMPPKYKK